MSKIRESIIGGRRKMFDDLHKELDAIGDWYVFYTHPYNGDDSDKNMLVFPKKVSDADFYGMILDLVNDYNAMKGLPVENNLYVECLIRVLEKAQRGEIDLREKP